jgi:RNA polymerase sigma-70 factor (ECF subfamily)
MPESPEAELPDAPHEVARVTATGPDRSEGVVDDTLSELVQAARGGDQAAFAALVEATHRDTFTLAVRLTGNEEDARDVTQEAYLRAYRGLSRFRGDAQFSTWMYRITANCAATYLGRRNRHRHDALPDGAEVVDLRSDHDPELAADGLDLRDRLLTALDTLPPKLRAVVVLRDVYELSHDAIAEELGISTTAAKVRLHRARHKLRSEVFPELDQVASRAV